MQLPQPYFRHFYIIHNFHQIKALINYKFDRPCIVHGIASWFDVVFPGTTEAVWLSTSPFAPLTHWYQVCIV